MDVVQSNLDILFREAEIKYGSVLEQTKVWMPQVATIMPSKSRQVDYGWLARLPIMRQWIGPRVLNAVSTHVRSVKNIPFEISAALHKDDVEDDQFGVFNMTVTHMAAACAKWPDIQLAQFLRGAAATVGYDGKNVYATDHPINGGDVAGGPSGTQSNLFVNTALTYENYVAVRTAMMAFKGEDGQPLTVMPDLLVVPPQLEGKAKNILESDFLAGINSVVTAPQSNVYKNTARVLVVAELADQPNNWWLLDTSKVVKPFIWQLRQAPRFTYLTNPSDLPVFMQKEFIYGADARGAAAESLYFLSSAATSEAQYTHA